MTVACYFCGEKVDPNSRDVWRRVTGWEHKVMNATRKGGSDISMREPTGELACSACMIRVRQGLSPQQETLV